MEIPFDAIKKQVKEVKNDIMSRLDPISPAPVFEHVGSTSIRGQTEVLLLLLMLLLLLLLSFFFFVFFYFFYSFSSSSSFFFPSSH